MKLQILPLILAFFISPFADAQQLDLDLFANNLNRPVAIKHANDDKLYIAEQAGYVKIVNSDGTVNSTPFLDIDRIVKDRGSNNDERGLLGIAFHPNYSVNGYVYANYINNDGNTVISRFTRTASNPLFADIDSEFIILTYAQPYSNHNGGDMAFGSDGYLYIASGDGGSAGDADNNAQNTMNLLGNILRIDINSTTDTTNYTIPPNNPFVGDSSVRDEIWAYGLRNPWRFSFDSLNGDVWIADVGQDGYEEINKATAEEANSGLNYGWRCYEGNSPYELGGCSSQSNYTFPLSGYSHTDDGEPKCSITGGYVYRGDTYINFKGWYFFADLCSQEIGYLVYDESNMTWSKTFVQFSGQWTTFGEDVNGELYISDFSGGNIYKLVDTTLSVDDNSLSAISVYPNPAKTHININYGGIINKDILTDISIYDIRGKKLITLPVTDEITQKYDVSNFSDGIYILKIRGKNGIQNTHKLVIN